MLPYLPEFVSKTLYKHDEFLYKDLYQSLSSTDDSIDIKLLDKNMFFSGQIYIGSPS